MKEIAAPFIELTTEQAGKFLGISGQAMRRRCQQGLIDAYRTEGGQWRVKFRPEEVMPQEETDALRRENMELKMQIEAIRRLVAG